MRTTTGPSIGAAPAALFQASAAAFTSCRQGLTFFEDSTRIAWPVFLLRPLKLFEPCGAGVPRTTSLIIASPRLPFLFRVSPKLKYVRTITVERLLNGFTKTPFVEAFRDVCDEFDEADDIERVVLLFPWPTMKRGRFMAVHTADCGCAGDVLVSKEARVKRLGRVPVHLSRLSLLLTSLDGTAADYR